MKIWKLAIAATAVAEIARQVVRPDEGAVESCTLFTMPNPPEIPDSSSLPYSSDPNPPAGEAKP